jgi:Cys-tRNA(Pro) deacylase
MHPSAQRVQEALRGLGFSGDVVELEASTRTAVEAAQAAGCEVGQIVKSLVFRLQAAQGLPGEPVLVLVSGTNRVHEKQLGRLLGGSLVRTDADDVHAVTGFSIGGVPPIGHKNLLKTYIDQDLLQYPVIWAAAGTSNAIFQISPTDLVRISGAQIIQVT